MYCASGAGEHGVAFITKSNSAETQDEGTRNSEAQDAKTQDDETRDSEAQDAKTQATETHNASHQKPRDWVQWSFSDATRREAMERKTKNNQTKLKEALYKSNGFNGFVSDRISLWRSLPDIRHPHCK